MAPAAAPVCGQRTKAKTVAGGVTRLIDLHDLHHGRITDDSRLIGGRTSSFRSPTRPANTTDSTVNRIPPTSPGHRLSLSAERREPTRKAVPKEASVAACAIRTARERTSFPPPPSGAWDRAVPPYAASSFRQASRCSTRRSHRRCTQPRSPTRQRSHSPRTRASQDSDLITPLRIGPILAMSS